MRTKILFNLMRQLAGNLFRTHWIIFFGVLHSLYFYHRLLLKFYKESIYTACYSPTLLTTSTFAAAAYVFCNLPPIHLSIMSRSLYWLIQNDYPIIRIGLFSSFFQIHNTSPKFSIRPTLPYHARTQVKLHSIK